MPNDPDILNIPAYQRKKSLNQKMKKLGTGPSVLRNIKSTGKDRPIQPLSEISITQKNAINDLELMEQKMEKMRTRRKKVEEMKVCGICEGYFEKIEVAIIKLHKPLRQDDEIIFEKEDGLFKQKVDSMQLNKKTIKIGHSGDSVGLKVLLKPTVGGTVYKVI